VASSATIRRIIARSRRNSPGPGPSTHPSTCRCDQEVAEQRGPAGRETDQLVIVGDEVVLGTGLAGHQGAQNMGPLRLRAA
jgi:hypothetical protein